jgi:hypothetical protein
MKRHFTIILLVLTSFLMNSCNKQEYFKSESGIKSQLIGTWKLIPIPKYDYNQDGSKFVHEETWTFREDQVSMLNNNQAAVSNYTVNTTMTKAEIKIENVQPVLTYPARIRINTGTWQIVRLDDEFLIIANDQDGQTGLTELEFQKN